MENYKSYDSFEFHFEKATGANEGDESYDSSEKETEEYEEEEPKEIINLMSKFNQCKTKEETVRPFVHEILKYSFNHSQFMIKHPLFRETQLINHLISIITSDFIPNDIKIESIYIINQFIPYFSEEDATKMSNHPFIGDIYGIFMQCFEPENIPKPDLDRILLFLSNLASASESARNEITWNFPLEETCSSVDEKFMKVVEFIYDSIKTIGNRTHIKYLIFFLKNLCYYPLSESESKFLYSVALQLIQQFPDFIEYLLKINRYLCKNGFSYVVASNPSFFEIFRVSDFFTNRKNVLKCWAKIIKSIVELNVDLSRLLNLPLLTKLISCDRLPLVVLDEKHSVIVMDVINYMLSFKPSSKDVQPMPELQDIYLDAFLRNKLFLELQFVLDSETGGFKHKISALMILKTIAYKQNKILLNVMVKKQFVKTTCELLDCESFDVLKVVLPILLLIIHNVDEDGVVLSVLGQITEIDGYQKLVDLQSSIEEMEKNKETEEIHTMVMSAIRKLDELNAKHIEGVGEFILEDEPEDEIVRDLEEKEKEEGTAEIEFNYIKEIRKYIESLPEFEEEDDDDFDNNNDNDEYQFLPTFGNVMAFNSSQNNDQSD